MDLIAFSVENVRSVRDLVVVEDLRRWEVLHGENNVGKSNLLLGLRTALALMDKVWTHKTGENFDADSMALAPGVALLALDDLDARLAPHWDREDDPIRLGLRFSTPSQATAATSIHFTAKRQDNAWRVEGRWAEQDDLDLRQRDPSGAPVPFKAPAIRFVDAARRPPKGALSWDEWLLTQVDTDDDGGPWLAAQRRLEGALAELVPSFEGGRLDRRMKEVPGRRGQERAQELVWRTPTDRRLRFEDQGSGVRAAKDLLVAATAGEGLCLIEEPELHLSEVLQRDLRGLLEQLAAPGPGLRPLQFILTSHTAMFDHGGARKVGLREGTTVLAPRGVRVPSPIDLNAAWVAGGANNSGYVNDSGVLLLPPSVRDMMTLPTLVRFVPNGRGAFSMAPNSLEGLAKEEGGFGEDAP